MVLPILGAIGGLAAGAGALKSAFGGNKSTASAAPWGPAQNQLKDILGEAKRYYNNDAFRVDPYPAQRVAPYSAMTNSGIGMLGRIEGQTPEVRSAFNDMLSGNEMYRDFDTIRGNVADRTKAELASVFAGGGANSGLAQDTYTRALGGALGDVEYGAWNQAQNRRLAALGLAPAMQGLDMTAAGARLTGGGLKDDLAQRRINADMTKWNERQTADMDALMRYSALVQGIGGLGGQSTSTSPTSLTDWGNMFSGAGTALSAASTLFGNSAPGA